MVSFVFYDLSFLVIFTLAVALFLYTRKHNLKRQGLLYLYRTKLGLKLMDWTVDKFGRFLRPLQYVIVASGYILLVAMVWLLARFTWIYTQSTVFVQAIKIPPIIPLVPYLPDLFKIDFLPPFYFTYWIIIIAIIAVSHEFAHGIFARLNKIKVKSTGFGFLGPFLAAFVEPDEKQMNKAPKFQQLSILAAGTFANVLMTILFGLILWVFFTMSFMPAGVNFNTYGTEVISVSAITSIGGKTITDISEIPAIVNESLIKIKANGEDYLIPGNNLKLVAEQETERIIAYTDSPAINANLRGSITEIGGVSVKNLEELREQILKNSPGDEIIIKTKVDNEELEFNIVLGEKEGQSYLGIGTIVPQREGLSGIFYNFISDIKDPTVYYEPKFDGDFAWFIYNLLWWTVIINISVALVNMLPVGIFDGGRFFYLTVWGITGNEKIGRKSFAIATWLIIGVLVWLMVRWAIAFS